MAGGSFIIFFYFVKFPQILFCGCVECCFGCAVGVYTTGVCVIYDVCP